jgi:hypothetical protein
MAIGEEVLAKESSSMIDLILRVIGVAMGIAAVALIATRLISVENAIILLGIGIVAMALERLPDR